MRQLLGTPTDHVQTGQGGGVAPLASVSGAVDAFLRGRRAVAGIAPGLLVTDPDGWTPATALIDGDAIGELLDRPRRHWGARPHAAAALSWKAYTYWLAVPVVLGWLSDRRIPLLDADNVLVRLCPDRPQLILGLRTPRVAVLRTDPAADHPDAVPVASTSALLALLRATLLDDHLAPLAARTRARVRIGERVLLGQLAAALANLTVAASVTGHAAGRDPADEAAALLDALDLADLASVGRRPGGGPCSRRTTCCLAFTVPGLGVCGNCCVPAARR